MPRASRQRAGCAVYLKAENLQRGGAFKLRGAYNKVSSLSDAERRRGVIAHSSGNHAIAVAYACQTLGVKAVIVIPSNAVEAKVDATRALGAEVVRCGPNLSDREDTTRQLADSHGYVLVHPFDDPLIMAGQGTAGLEVMEALPDVRAVLSPVGGGGLLVRHCRRRQELQSYRQGDWRGTAGRQRCSSLVSRGSPG